MKKFWLVLLSLGLIMAFSVSAFAVDVKVSGEYYAAGLYLNRINTTGGHGDGTDIADYNVGSTAFYFQRLRVGTDFIVSPCLKLVTRFDAMERIWGGARSYPGYGGASPHENSGLDSTSAGTRAENENIAFDLVYIDYTAPVGQFRVGYQKESTWGTIFGNNGEATPTGQIRYDGTFGAFSVVAMIAKMTDFSYSAVTYEDQTDHDYDSYRVGGIYKFKNDKVNGEAGVLLIYGRDATHKHEGSSSYMTRAYTVNPYFKTAIGPVALQGEGFYTFGDSKDYDAEGNTYTDVKIDAWRLFLDGAVKVGIVNAGLSVAWLSGDDTSTSDRAEGYSNAGIDWNPCLIMFNNDIINYWVGGLASGHDGNIGGPMSNAWFFQGRVGVNPTPQLNVLLSVSHAFADKKPSGFANGTYGTEIDLTGTYKITNNLSYMLGAGYLFTGNYYGDTCIDPIVDNDFILINKLTLTF
ncbi:MAG: hypothetical protein CVU62_02765 [Deltaproteobacteria bacterium HGW-Deltaproteobacteria-2]|jgi:hypothetical protein|nr:MAG: hypothetical protein CVU62_02765 [Deltaproteobacteria bacterium HGW-Deltaproteobacteria-2]